MIDNIHFNYRAADPNIISAIAHKMKDHNSGPNLIHFTPNDPVLNLIHPMQARLYADDRVRVTGSIHKFFNKKTHTNDNDFSWNDFLVAIDELCDILNIDLNTCDPIITTIEIGLNHLIPIEVGEFLIRLQSYKNNNFQYSKPKKGSVKKWGKEVRQTDFDIQFYNKSWLANRELKGTTYFSEKLLRFEIVYNLHTHRYIKCNTLSELKKSKTQIRDLLINNLDTIQFKPLVDYSLMNFDEIMYFEGFSNPEFSTNIKSLDKYKKARLLTRYRGIQKKYKADYKIMKDIIEGLKDKVGLLM